MRIGTACKTKVRPQKITPMSVWAARRACAARVTVVVLDVCLLFLISTLAKLYMQITVLTYVAENEDQNKRAKLASLLS